MSTVPTSSQARIVVVTGASSGIGRAIATTLGAAGFALRLIGRSADGLHSTADAIDLAGGPPASCQVLDVAIPDALADFVRQVGREPEPLFALVNNAGVMHPEPVMLGDPKRWRSMFDINVLAPLEGCRAAVEVMRRQGGAGHLINISSIAAGWETGGVYAASKRAQEIISSSLRQELERDNIRVTTIVPGGFASQLARDFEPATFEKIAAGMKSKGFTFGPDVDERLIGDPQHIARAIHYILCQPININFERVVIRPPIDTAY